MKLINILKEITIKSAPSLEDFIKLHNYFSNEENEGDFQNAQKYVDIMKKHGAYIVTRPVWRGYPQSAALLSPHIRYKLYNELKALIDN